MFWTEVDERAQSYAGHDNEGRMTADEAYAEYLAERAAIRAEAAERLCDCGSHLGAGEVLCGGCESELDGQGFVWRFDGSLPVAPRVFSETPF